MWRSWLSLQLRWLYPWHYRWNCGQRRTLVSVHRLPELSCSIRRQARSDGVYFWHWEIIESCKEGGKLRIASGNVFGSRDYAVRDAKKAVRDYWAALPWYARR